jgi:hypothetical protein
MKSGYINFSDYNLSDDYIKLLIWIAADGNLVNSNLVRIRVFKQRKIDRIRNLLNVLTIPFTENIQKDKSICFNFNIPKTLESIQLKPLSNIVLNFSERQVKVLLEEYSHTDGYYNNSSLLIYTSKKQEADLLQQVCIQNGYTCNIAVRINHGYSKVPNYELTITHRTHRTHQKLKTKVQVQQVEDEHFWCVKVPNTTIFIRRNGKPLLIGNSHDNLEHTSWGKSMDVGVPSAYRILGEYRPFSFEEIKTILDQRETLTHH